MDMVYILCYINRRLYNVFSLYLPLLMSIKDPAYKCRDRRKDAVNQFIAILTLVIAWIVGLTLVYLGYRTLK